MAFRGTGYIVDIRTELTPVGDIIALSHVKEGTAMSSDYGRFSDVPFSRISDQYGNDVTYERNAPGGSTIWGARVYPPYNDGTILVKQTVRKDREFVIDKDEKGRHRERHVDLRDDAALLQAIRDALQGRLGEE